jgi:hypothetical protein
VRRRTSSTGSAETRRLIAQTGDLTSHGIAPQRAQRTAPSCEDVRSPE